MSLRCYICRKGTITGNRVSHSNRKTKRLWKPNLQKIRILVGGKAVRRYVCTKCLKKGRVKKAI